MASSAGGEERCFTEKFFIKKFSGADYCVFFKDKCNIKRVLEKRRPIKPLSGSPSDSIPCCRAFFNRFRRNKQKTRVRKYIFSKNNSKKRGFNASAFYKKKFYLFRPGYTVTSFRPHGLHAKFFSPFCASSRDHFFSGRALHSFSKSVSPFSFYF